mmetsp:Transcript_89070/g.191126  ORF Transcript_89070/g.191126 Transcript_89070/m.191126 type:complete len:250 (+) Transcript_89070:45-794(+)
MPKILNFNKHVVTFSMLMPPMPLRSATFSSQEIGVRGRPSATEALTKTGPSSSSRPSSKPSRAPPRSIAVGFCSCSDSMVARKALACCETAAEIDETIFNRRGSLACLLMKGFLEKSVLGPGRGAKTSRSSCGATPAPAFIWRSHLSLTLAMTTTLAGSTAEVHLCPFCCRPARICFGMSSSCNFRTSWRRACKCMSTCCWMSSSSALLSWIAWATQRPRLCTRGSPIARIMSKAAACCSSLNQILSRA